LTALVTILDITDVVIGLNDFIMFERKAITYSSCTLIAMLNMYIVHKKNKAQSLVDNSVSLHILQHVVKA